MKRLISKGGIALYKIAICEDEEIFSTDLASHCNEICKDLRIEYNVKIFKSGEDFLSVFKSQPLEFDLILLDIIMGNLNGIEVAKHIRERNAVAAIIFITSNKDSAAQGYEVKALRYLMKPIDKVVLKQLIGADYQDRFQQVFIIIKSGSDLIKIPITNIIALEIAPRKVMIHLYHETLFHAGKLDDLLSQLPMPTFVRCHKSFALNINNIRELNKQNAVGVNGMLIPVSRSYMKSIKIAFLKSMEMSL